MTVLLSHLVIPSIFFFPTFDSFIVRLGSTNILFDRMFLTFNGTLILTHIWQFYRHIGIWAIPTSHVAVFLSHSIVPPFFFPHIWWFQHYIWQYHIWQYFCYIRLYLYFFFLTFDGSIFKLCSIKITCDCTFVTLVVQSFFLASDSSIVTLSSTNIIFNRTFLTFDYTLIFFFTFDGIVLTLCNTNITCNYTSVTFGAPLISLSHLMVPLSH